MELMSNKIVQLFPGSLLLKTNSANSVQEGQLSWILSYTAIVWTWQHVRPILQLAEFLVWFPESLGKYAFCHIASIPARTLSEYAFMWLQKWFTAWKIPISKIFPYLSFCFPLFIPLPSDLLYLSPSSPFLTEIFTFFTYEVPQLAINFPFKNNPLHLIQVQFAFYAAFHGWSLAQLFSSNTVLKKSCNQAPFWMSNTTKRRLLFRLALHQHPFKSTPHHFIVCWHKPNPWAFTWVQCCVDLKEEAP